MSYSAPFPLCCWRLQQRWILTQVQTELFCRRPHQPVIVQIQYTRDEASVVASCVHVCVCFRVSTERCVFMSVRMSLFKMMEDRWYWFFFSITCFFPPNFKQCTSVKKKKEKEMVGYGPFINASQYAASTELALGCGSCFHTELSNLFVLPGEELRDKEAKCKCKTSHDRIWQETEIFSIPLWCSLLHSLNHFNLPLNTIPSRLNFDHCHFKNLQDWKDWDKCIIHPTHQFGSPLLSVMHFCHLPVSFVFCSLCSVEAS